MRLHPSTPIVVLSLLALAAACGGMEPGASGGGGGSSHQGGGGGGGSGGGGAGGGTAPSGGGVAGGGASGGGATSTGGGDASPADAATPDAATLDAGTSDAGRPDAGSSDAGRPDAGPPATRPMSNGTFQTLTNVSYAPGAGHGMDLYLPNGAGPWPTILFIHGGAWLEGDKGDNAQVFRREAQRGYAVASINYRLVPSVRFPANLHDVKAAARFLRANAAKYKLDPSRLVAMGDSAGAHLAMMLGTSGGVAALEDLSMGNPTESSRVQAVVSLYGPTDFLQMDAQTPQGCANANHNGAGSPESQLVNCAIQTCKPKVAEANPITYVDPNDPPTVLLHGTRDCTVAPGQSELMRAALANANVKTSLVSYQGLGHNFIVQLSTAMTTTFETFIDGVLYP